MAQPEFFQGKYPQVAFTQYHPNLYSTVSGFSISNGYDLIFIVLSYSKLYYNFF